MSGGSWVFNKKDKGSNDVYARFCLKLIVPAEDMVTRISFEFLQMGGSKNIQKAESGHGDRNSNDAPIS